MELHHHRRQPTARKRPIRRTLHRRANPRPRSPQRAGKPPIIIRSRILRPPSPNHHRGSQPPNSNVDFLPADHIPRNSKGEIQPGIAPVGYGAHLNPVTALQHPDAGGAEIEFQIPQYPVAAWTAPKGFEYRFGKLPRGVAATVVPAEIFYGATRAVPAALRDSADESRQNPFYPQHPT